MKRRPAPPSSSKLFSTIATVSTALIALVAVVILYRQTHEPAVPSGESTTRETTNGRPLADATFVGSATCAACHARESEAWQTSQHAAAMAEASDATVKGRFDGRRVTYAGLTTTFSRRGGEFVVRTDGPDGAPHDYVVRYTFGVSPLQQYLVEFPDGRLQALPFGWDTRPEAAGGQRWFHLYPAERIKAGDPLHWTGLNQNWNFMCADCHSTNVRKGYDSSTHAFRTTWSEISVGCEACHGPASAHVAWARRPDRGTAPAGAYLTAALARPAAWRQDPSSGQPVRETPRRDDVEIEVCARCHALRSQMTDDVRAGDPLEDGFRPSFLEPGAYHPDGQQHREVYTYASFLQSRMYANGVTCSDCHEPHGGTLRASGNALCTRCHDAAKYDQATHTMHATGTGASQCVTCHMPLATFMVIDPRHDHSLRVPRPDRAAALGVPDVCTSACHTNRKPQWAADALTRAGHTPAGFQRFADAFAAGERNDPRAGALLAEVAADGTESAMARASAVSRMTALGRGLSLTALQRMLDDPSPLVRRAAVGALRGAEPADRARLLPRMLRDPRRTIRSEAAVALADLGDTALAGDDRAAFVKAFDEFEREQRYNGDRPDARTALGTALGMRGRFDPARIEFEEAIRLDPTHLPAYVNLADLHRSRQDEASAERVLRQALSANPGSADVRHALGLSLVRQKRIAEALPELREASRLAPDNARYAYVAGVALHDAGQPAEATRVLEAALARHPADRDLLYVLAAYARQSGRIGPALDYASRLLAIDPSDRDAQALVNELSGTAGAPVRR